MNALGTDFSALARAGKLAQNAEPGKGFPADTAGYVAEVKWDGWRILAVVCEDGVKLYSRSGKTYNGMLPKIEAELTAALPVGTVLDGEVVAVTIDGEKVINEWGTTQSALTKFSAKAVQDKVTYAVFDLIAHAGIDARALSYAKRRVLMERLFETQSFEAVVLTPQIEPTPEAYEAAIAQGFEGVVLKRLNARYASDKRGHGWRKAKPTTTIEGVVMGFKPGKPGGWTEGMVGSVVFGQYDENGKLVERGHVSGMDMRTRTDMTKHPEKWLGRVIEVAHEGWDIGNNGDGGFRFPRFKRVRDDRSAESVLVHNA